MEAGKFSLESNPFDFHRSIQVVSLSYRVLAERSGVGFTLDLDPRIDTLEGTLIGDDMRLRQVVSNLVSNALKFAGSVKVVTRLVSQHPRGGRGSLRPPDIAASPNPSNHSDPDSTRPKPSTVVVRVEVHDTGVGLSSHDVTGAGLFSPYVQTEIGRRQGGKGSGLGLALVRQIVTLSKGRLGVESQVGKGSNFW
ncbi:hypothetical protein Q8F55_006139 [Vanrija albida]|uniref:histidine kinase n=1 Tax=Vanrija albida TaxID=181172 RepID=A0ABR3PWC4_9TREE